MGERADMRIEMSVKLCADTQAALTAVSILTSLPCDPSVVLVTYTHSQEGGEELYLLNILALSNSKN